MPITRETTLAPEQPKLEAETREEIDQKLIAAGWVVQDKNRLNLYESLGVAVMEPLVFPSSRRLKIPSGLSGIQQLALRIRIKAGIYTNVIPASQDPFEIIRDTSTRLASSNKGRDPVSIKKWSPNTSTKRRGRQGPISAQRRNC